MATPFKVDWSDEAFDALKARVRSYRLPDQPDDSDWSYGCDPQTLRELCAYWVDRYDVDAMVRDLNCFPQFTTEVDGLRLHFVHVRGEAESKRPLLLIHGWPGSTYEFWPAVEALAFPSRNGGRADDAFDLVVPSLPGYGFSAKPNQPIDPRRIGALFNALMREVLGYDRYLVHGTDWGAVIGPWMALDQANSILGLHIDYLGTVPEDAPQDDTERRWMQQFADYEKRLGAYSHLQSTRVQSLAYAMHNNPVAQAAWLLERFHDWADLGERSIIDVFGHDRLITSIMLYVMTDTFATSTWIYTASEREKSKMLPKGRRIEVPTGYASWPDPRHPAPPRSLVERTCNLVHWSEQPRGGHFPPTEQPEAFVADLRAWVRGIAA
ncbi:MULTISPECIES: epoxide hydrolase family protein [unclassified Neorhizobium]|uniref:epoxide hydrolase family protein n=1 Tax=unclassified Neorhizobium TaxID=2629175 RepID=UPI001FF1BE89|nr:MULTISPECIES: epoxide hydrolase family protein [unclassified Neorhizobium]MCJ9668475.1 epoxide hydrolase [Neorhizobium sp. SHOUNA12B]MCJ9743994.1 epoxide hydrolase [Neorhizobium sp. SHOUNA12A]